MVAVLACRPLGPGETRCTTSMVFGTAVTNCKTGQQPPPEPMAAPRPPPGWWCTNREDGFGACLRVPGQCEAYRAGAPSGCYASPAACAMMERQAGRDGGGCVVAQ